MSKFRFLIEDKIKNAEHVNFYGPRPKKEDGHDDFHMQHAPTSHIDSIKNYGNFSKTHNRTLWKGETSNEIENVSNGLKSAPAAKEDFHVYTGISGRNVKEKGDIHIPAFTSATTSKHVASEFVSPQRDRHTIEQHPDEHGNMVDHSVHHIIKIHVKKGQQVGAYIEHISPFKGENEFLINKNHTIHMSGNHEDHPHPASGFDNMPRIYRIHHATITPHGE